MRRGGRIGPIAGLLIILCSLAVPGSVHAYQATPDFEIRANYRQEAYVRLPQGTDYTFVDPNTSELKTQNNDILMSQRNELRLDIEWQLHTECIWPWLGKSRFVMQMRPWFDTSYYAGDGGASDHRDVLTPYWSQNVSAAGGLDGDAANALRDEADPFFREYYIDIAPEHFFFRIGRQIIPWGKSDGVYMLDIINPFDLRNPTIFEEENFKIPVWAANLNWQPGPDQNIQLLYIPKYLNNVWGGINVRRSDGASIESRFHDWTYKIVGFFNDFYNGEFGSKVPVQIRTPANTIGNSIVGLRWSDTIQRVNYTLNFLYTFTPSLIDFPDTGTFATATSVVRQPGPERMYVIGASADYDINVGSDWFDGLVMRAETAGTLHDQYYKGALGNPVNTDHWGLMTGLDKTILADYLERPVFASLQYWQDLVLGAENCNGCGPNAGSYQDLGFNGGHQGLRGPYKSLMTLYLYKTFLPGDTLITEFFTLYEIQFADWWVRPKLTYKINDDTTMAVGWNVFAGGSQTPYGEWKDNTNAFVEFRRTLF
jgi:uncharacterized protein DUF1302